MEMLLQPAAVESSAARRPLAWLRDQQLARPFWTFFAAAFFFDAGFAVYFFLFNLFLLDLGFTERTMGLIGGALTLGSLVGTLPAGALARRLGVRPLLFLCFIAAPLCGVLRTSFLSPSAQIALAFLAGLAMCLWGICFLPAVARLTTESNRSAGFGLIFAASLGTSTLGGILCSYLPRWLAHSGILLQPAALKRLILLASCCIALLGLVPLTRLRLPEAPGTHPGEGALAPGGLSSFCLSSRSLLIVALIALWAGVQSAFTPFAMVHLTRDFNIPLQHTALLFSVAQTLQLIGALATPFLFRSLGLARGIAATQALTAACLALMALTPSGRAAVVFYLGFAAAQWMASPGMYNLLMSSTPDPDRGSAAALAMFANSLIGSAATVLAGSLLIRFGYPSIMLSIATAALALALVTWNVAKTPQMYPICDKSAQFPT